MPTRTATLLLSVALIYSTAHGQASYPDRPGASGWRSAESRGPDGMRLADNSNAKPLSESADSPVTQGDESGATKENNSSPGNPSERRRSRAQVSKGSGTLPNDHGQVWREYDISPYTHRVQSTSSPEKAIVDWILRETGYEAWHSTPVGLLSADNKLLRVYHTPQMQNVVADIVDRFVNNDAENIGFGLRIVTIENPNWRARALPFLKSIPVQSPGVQGWILAKEDEALLLSELKRRTDYHEHNAPHQMVQNGQSLVISTMRPVNYIKGIIPTQQTWPGFQPEQGQIDVGFSMEFNPLLSMDTRTVDAVIKLRLTQVEKMISVKLEVPSAVAQNQRTECQVPQMTMVQLHERFRWPTDQVLLLSMGVVAKPGAEKPNFITDALPILKSPPRADALLFVESKGALSTSSDSEGSSPPMSATRSDQTYHGRY